MLKKTVSALLLTLPLVSAAEVVAPAESTPVAVKFAVEFSPPTSGGDVTGYKGRWLRDGETVSSFTLPATATAARRTMQVVNGNEICVQITAVNPGNTSPTWQECLEVNWLPAGPGVPEDVTVTYEE